MIIKKRDLEAIVNSVPDVNNDPSSLKRGWYVCLDPVNGNYYLASDGTPTHGVKSFWPTRLDAENALSNWLDPRA